jgi:hypothetical protein
MGGGSVIGEADSSDDVSAATQGIRLDNVDTEKDFIVDIDTIQVHGLSSK